MGKCNCEHWQSCPKCHPEDFDAEGKMHPICEHHIFRKDCNVCALRADNARLAEEVKLLNEVVAKWQWCGDEIMEALFGKRAPLSDSDVIGEFTRLRNELARLNGRTNYRCECGGTRIEAQERDDALATIEAVREMATKFQRVILEPPKNEMDMALKVILSAMGQQFMDILSAAPTTKGEKE